MNAIIRHETGKEEGLRFMYRVFWALKLSIVSIIALTSVSHAQLSDPRVAQLEEQLRQLTGQFEELNFQLLQMQENLRRQQEDIEYRLQELEDEQQGSVISGETPSTELAATDQAGSSAGTNDTPVQTTSNLPAAGTPNGSSTAPRLGEPPRSLGSIQLDANGNVIETSIDFSAQSVEQSIDGTQVASLGGEFNAEELYMAGYRYILDGDYSLAEEVFSTFVDTYPNDPLIADARFWLGESLLAQGRFEDAADAFIVARSLHPDAAKAPETLYKIGFIMAALGNRQIACVTFEDALKTHTDMSDPLRNKIGAERAKAKC